MTYAEKDPWPWTSRLWVTCGWLLETAPFDKLHTSTYLRSAVTMALSCIVSDILTVE